MAASNRPAYFDPIALAEGRKVITEAWKARYGFVVKPEGATKPVINYVPTPKQLDFHESLKPNCIIEGSRGTGKSVCIRMDAHMRALAYPGYSCLIVRRTMPELKKSHLKFIAAEMKALGGSYHKTDHIATYKNGSTVFFGHAETEDDMMKYLSSEFHAIYFDEISTFSGEMIAKIGTCVRVTDEQVMGIVRGGTNPIGEGADYVRSHYIDKDVSPEDDDSYDPNDYEAIHTTLDDNPHIDKAQYIKRLSNLPDHLRRAWLEGEWVIEGAYFHDFRPTKNHQPWHVIQTLPLVKQKELRDHNWIQVYRAIDWGFSPDPCVCLWIAVLPNGRSVVIKERHFRSTTAQQVAKVIKAESEGLHIVETFCDPTMFFGSEATGNNSIGDIFEAHGVYLTPIKNDREAAGFAIHEYLSTELADGLPKLQIYGPACPMLAKTLPEQRIDKNNARKIANGNDHWTIALAYYCMASTGISRESYETVVPLWMRPKKSERRRIGSESVSAGTRLRMSLSR